MPKLHISSPEALAGTIELANNHVTIGRTEDNEICIPDHNVSKRHGILVRDGDDYQLHDFNSTNGTFVNGVRIMAVKLQHGASIRLGAVELRYESSPAQTAVAPLGVKQADTGLKPSPPKDRGMSKRNRQDFAPGGLQSGPVTIQPGSLAKPVLPKDNS